MSSHNAPPVKTDRDVLYPPRSRTGGGSLSSTAPRPSFAPPGSFNAELRSNSSQIRLALADTIRPELASHATYRTALADFKEDALTSEQRVAEYREKIQREVKIKTGTENLLEALHVKGTKQTKDQRAIVESELQQSNRKIAQLTRDLDAEIQRAKEPQQPPPVTSRLSQLFKSTRDKSPGQQDDGYSDSYMEDDEGNESPTYALSNLLQELESPGQTPGYYVERGNSIVELLDKHQTLKYDLAWSVFGLRIQALLLSDNREVAASGYRVMRYAIKDQKSLRTIRSFHTDYLVILSLIKDSKASVEREQALKFVRAFLNVPGGIDEVSKAIIRAIVAIAEHRDDRMRNLSILTLAEMMVKNPQIVMDAGGLGMLSTVLAEGDYKPAESLGQAFLYLLDNPSTRQYFRSGHEIDGAFATFTNGDVEVGLDELKNSAKVISALLKSWVGLSVLSSHNLASVKSLVASMYVPSPLIRDTLLELVLDVLRIKAPSWSSSFLAGRRLTTYGRVFNLTAESKHEASVEIREDLVEHFVAILLAVLIKAGVIEALLFMISEEQDQALKRKATLLLGEVLNMANNSLPSDWTAKLQALPSLFGTAAMLGEDKRHVASSAIYQIDSVNRTLNRTTMTKAANRTSAFIEQTMNTTFARRLTDPTQDLVTPALDDSSFRSVITDTGVNASHEFVKWKWDVIEKVIEGPLQTARRFEDVLKNTKFIERLVNFYRPFKYRFCEVRNTKPNQRYVRTGVALVKMMLLHAEGVKFLAENKLIRQIAECLAQVDRLSGLTSSSPLFAADRMSDTLTCGYFALIGALTSDVKGLLILERWKMFNMFYHIIELQDRDDLIKALLVNLDYSVASHLRIILSKALTTCSKDVRIASTRMLRKYAASNVQSSQIQIGSAAYWAIDCLITQLYDPEIEVCEIAIKILEHACAHSTCLEFVVRRQPALDHLGEIGAPLLLKFLTTSSGYKYLDGLDYITQEMEDWFLGRNETYVTHVEAALTRALWTTRDKHGSPDEAGDLSSAGSAPPHFYRELTRTAEGCNLLIREGHFDEFVSTIENWRVDREDAETLLKIKGALWAIGNIGSMKLGASFLESTDVIQMIIKIAETSNVISMRGTATYVLGLLSKNVYGQEILAEHGWDATTDDMGQSVGICLPMDLAKLFAVPTLSSEQQARSLATTNGSIHPRQDIFSDENETFVEVLNLVNDLNNTVLLKKRAAELHAIKARKPRVFQSPRLFVKVMALLERYHFKLATLRFVIDLFDKQVMRRIVYDEEDDEDDDYETTVLPIDG